VWGQVVDIEKNYALTNLIISVFSSLNIVYIYKVEKSAAVEGGREEK
jgi:hypothetical protein